MLRLINIFLLMVITAGVSFAQDHSALEAEVAATENAFAKTMADRDFDAFKSFLDPDTVFWGGRGPLTGADEVAARWEDFYQEADAPFSWKSETVMINPDGNIAFSSGPVTSPDGVVYAYFNSVWRKNDAGEWKIIFDKGTNLNQ
ncbi:YybH family protein [Pseudemcibacter aquimaris]|uniref:YybH family protein n=1 Tax=Pseudemcibacter aquimaris TaxID=2857064 RepID=UPI0020133671|nr:nuclear transport factor 2 family protein [Pseudemcibacter aquimaris]MCC3860501.1 nuclear transport factor 2 family protein [Pseudemcibacter aquimaris]WDU59326.1 nuclear transport factor 2 family protein [Pseudemcibacter aquimaris]